MSDDPVKEPRPLPQSPDTFSPHVESAGAAEIGTVMKNVVPLGKTSETANENDGSVGLREKAKPKKRQAIERLIHVEAQLLQMRVR